MLFQAKGKACSPKGCDGKVAKPAPARLAVRQSEAEKEAARLKRVASCELRGGQLFRDCDCYHRNGLQDDCPRSHCALVPTS